MKQKLLIATTNQGKFKEIANELADLPFKIISLKDLDKKIKEPIEDQPTIEANAILKAKYYAKKTGFLTIADDTGLFIYSLKGWPGIESARIEKTDSERLNTILKKLKNQKNRNASFVTVAAFYDPKAKHLFTTTGECKGKILKKPVTKNGKLDWGYNPIFYVKSVGKACGEMSLQEKNLVSHRGKASIQMKFFLDKYYHFKQIFVPVSIIVKDKKMYLAQRRDHRKEYHKKWEFPGGLIDNGEDLMHSLIRETKEETGYNITVIEQLPNIFSKVNKEFNYQVFLMPFICKIKNGKYKSPENEVLGYDWCTIAEAFKKPLLTLNQKSLEDKNNLKVLKKYID